MDDDLARVGTAWRELRRGASTAALRRMLHTTASGQLDLGQVDTLELLVDAGAVRMGELADLLRVDASSATRAVQRLVADGYARRRADPCDRRGVIIEATPGGRATVEEMRARARSALEQLTSGFSTTEIRQLGELMSRLVGALDELMAGAAADEQSGVDIDA
jgi:DNA-binding MarR family transcriptional regulator